MKKGERTRVRLVEATGRLLQAQGYFGTGIKEILTESGAPRGSFYFHFPDGKEQLACEALQVAGEMWREKIVAAANSSADPGEAVMAVCEVLAQSLVESDYEAGCPLATVALEAAATSDPIHALCSKHFAQWEEVIAARLADVGVPEATRAALATTVLSAIEGAQVLSRAHRSPAPLRQVGSTLALIIATVVGR